MDYNRSKDGNENDIVEYARKTGFSVERLYYVGRGIPDLLIGGNMPCPHCGKSFWQELVVEIKQPKGKLRPNQKLWWERWNHEPRIAHSLEEFDRLVGRGREAVIRNRQDHEEDADQEGRAKRGR